MKRKQIMLIDDSSFALNIVGKALEMNGFPTLTFNDPKKAVEAYDPQHIAVVVTDYLMPYMNGLEVLHLIRKKNYHAHVIVYSGFPDEKMIKALKDNHIFFFSKPLNIELLIKQIKNILAKPRRKNV